MPHLKSLPANATAFDVFAAFPATYAPFAEFCQEVFRGPGPLPPRDRELIFAFCSRLNECKYCFGGHSASAHKLGVPEGTFEALLADIETSAVDAKLKPLLRLARKLNESPSRMTESDVAACSAAGWDDAAIHQAIALCCLANYMNRLVEACGIPADPALFARRAELAVAHGYAEPFRRKLAEKGAAAR
jgi:uncharacterized peroxidase-related enzyme